MAIRREAFTITGPAGVLEALLEVPDDDSPRAVGVVCHPHPLHGGTMNNKVVYTLARSLASLGIATLRFNFRGVGASAGAYDDGCGETDDALAAAATLRARWPGADLVVAGFSFGAAVAVRVALAVEPLALVTVAPSVERLPRDGALPQCPWLVVHGSDDALIGIDAVVKWLNDQPPGPELAAVDGAEHFFHGKLGEVRTAVEAFIAPRLDAARDDV